jgi:hypothetical protein
LEQLAQNQDDGYKTILTYTFVVGHAFSSSELTVYRRIPCVVFGAFGVIATFFPGNVRLGKRTSPAAPE